MAQHGQSELHQEELQTVAGRQEHAGYCQKGMEMQKKTHTQFASSLAGRYSTTLSMQACILCRSGAHTHAGIEVSWYLFQEAGFLSPG